MSAGFENLTISQSEQTTAKPRFNLGFQNIEPPRVAGIVKKYAIGGKFQKNQDFKVSFGFAVFPNTPRSRLFRKVFDRK